MSGQPRARLAQSVARGSHNPKVVSSILAPRNFTCDMMAEWSKAPDPSSGLFGGAGSNPAPVTSFDAGKLTPAWIRTRVARFKVWSANHYTTGAMSGAGIAHIATNGYVAQW